MPTRIVAVVNQKGGVAKTTTCANLGAVLAARGSGTLLVDLDPQANLTLGLRGGWKDLPYGLPGVLTDPFHFPLAAIVRQVGDLPLLLAPGHMEMARAEAQLAGADDGAYRLRQALDALQREKPFDWILIDCPPSLGLLTQNAILASTHLLVPMDPRLYAFAGMDTLNRLTLDLRDQHTAHTELLGVLLTMFERSTRLHRMLMGVVRERFGDKVFETVIPKSVRIAEAEIDGKPVVLFDRGTASAKAYEALADEVLSRVAG